MTTTPRTRTTRRKKPKQAKPLPTIWEVPDALWHRILPILEDFWPPKPTGRHHADWRAALNGILFRLRSGCQWDQLPRRFGPKSTVHDWFQRWCAAGVLQGIWSLLAAECDELGAVDWQWQSADGRLGKARFGGAKVGKNPTDRGKNGSKESVLVEGDGGPLGVVLAAANVNDHLLLRETIEAIVIERPEPTEEAPQHLCLDADYDNPASREVAEAKKYVPHIVPKEKAKRSQGRRRGAKPRRWVVERTIAWLSKCRGILVRYEKKDTNYLGLIQLACALLWYRRLHRLGHSNVKPETQNTS
jgi:putative transposase